MGRIKPIEKKRAVQQEYYREVVPLSYEQRILSPSPRLLTLQSPPVRRESPILVLFSHSHKRTLSQCCSCHRTFNVTTLSPNTVNKGLFAKKLKKQNETETVNEERRLLE